MQEIEAKFYVLDLEGIRRRLQALEALLIQPRIRETNLRFDLPDNQLRSEGRVLRLRQDSQTRLTYKGGSVNQEGALNRTEIEFVVEDFEKARQFLESLGYRRRFYYEKYRTTYLLQTLDVSVHVMLDELPYGNFVEIEGEGVESIRAAADRLGLRWERAIPASYHALFDRLCARHPDLDPQELSFAALKGRNVSMQDLSISAGDG